MSSYGPPGGPHPGQPQEPWRDGPPQPEYGQPTDPWGGQPASGHPAYPPTSPAYGEPGFGYQPGYGQVPQQQPYADPYPGQQYGAPEYAQPEYAQPEYGAPPPTGPVYEAPPQQPPRRRPLALILTVVAVAAIILCGGGAATYIALSGNDDDPTVDPTTSASAGDPSRSAGPTETNGPTSSSDARFAVKGQCVVNDGSNEKPVMRVVQCGPNTYEILERFDGTAQFTEKCGTVPNYTDYYYYDSSLDTLDYVLCLKRR